MDLDLNAHANARRWHGDRKARSAKQAKTLDANTRALRVAEKKAQAQLSKVRACRPGPVASRLGHKTRVPKVAERKMQAQLAQMRTCSRGWSADRHCSCSMSCC